MRFLCLFLLIVPITSLSCSGHDGCSRQDKSDSTLTCNGGERCCKDMKFTCTDPTCTVTIKGGGHDQFRGSTVFAMDSTSLTIKCIASGLRTCKNANIFCPMSGTCTCQSCPSSVKMYCPPGVTCNTGGATLVSMANTICKGTGSNMYCNNLDESIQVCPLQETECASIIWGVNHVIMTCENATGHSNRPRCPQYYQDKYDNIKYHTVNVTVTTNEDAAKPLVDFCKASIPPKNTFQKSNNRAFQIKSWDVGCEKKRSTLSNCKSACNSPQGCCGLTCASNSCSGGGCCAASKNICKAACDFIFDPQTTNVINVMNVTNVTRIVNQTRWINTTRWINRTRWINTTRYINQTRWVNTTRYINQTRWVNQTRYINKTINRVVNKTRYVNETRYNDKTRYVNKTRYINETIYINKTINQIVNKTRWINQTRWVWINRTRYVNETRYIDKYVNKSRYITIYEYNWTTRNKTVFRIKYNVTNVTAEQPVYYEWIDISTMVVCLGIGTMVGVVAKMLIDFFTDDEEEY